jgi:hypothetical protein
MVSFDLYCFAITLGFVNFQVNFCLIIHTKIYLTKSRVV